MRACQHSGSKSTLSNRWSFPEQKKTGSDSKPRLCTRYIREREIERKKKKECERAREIEKEIKRDEKRKTERV